MAIVQALLAFLARSIGRILSALFDWAVVALFGRTSGASHLRLSALVAAAAAWPVLLLGIVAPRLAALVVAFVPLSDRVPAGVVRAVWIALALAVPIVIGVAMALRRPPHGQARTEPTWRRIARGFPITIGLAAAFLIMLVAVPMLRVVSIARRRQDAHMALVTTPESYGAVAARIAPILGSQGIPVQPADPPWWISAPSRVLLRLGGDAFRGFVPERPAYARSPDLEVALYPSGLLLRGAEAVTTHAHGVLVEALADTAAFQTLHPDAQALEKLIHQAWARAKAPAKAPAGGPLGGGLRAPADEIAQELKRLTVPYDDWQTLYRQLLQLDRALHGRPQLLSPAGARGQELDMRTGGEGFRADPAGAEPREAARVLDVELDDVREELSLLADDLDRRREAVDLRVQLRRHPVGSAVAGGVLGLVGGFALLAVRRRRPPEVPSARTW